GRCRARLARRDVLDFGRALLLRGIVEPGRRVAREFHRACFRVYPAIQVGGRELSEQSQKYCDYRFQGLVLLRQSAIPSATAAATRDRTFGSRMRASSSRLTITPASTSTDGIAALPTARLS